MGYLGGCYEGVIHYLPVSPLATLHVPKPNGLRWGGKGEGRATDHLDHFDGMKHQLFLIFEIIIPYY